MARCGKEEKNRHGVRAGQSKGPEFIEYRKICRKFKTSCRECREKLYLRDIKEMEDYFDKPDMYNFFQKLDVMIGGAGSRSKENSRMLWEYLENGDRRFLVEEKETMRVRSQYFKQLLNQQSVVRLEVASTLRAQEGEQTVYDEPLKLDELEEAITQLKSRKATGLLGIPIEPIKFGAEESMNLALLKLFQEIWRTGVVPQEYRNSIITVLFKSGAVEECTNYRGLSLNEHQGKLLERLVLNRLIPLVANVRGAIPDSQCGFVQSRSTMDAMAVSRMCATELRGKGVKLYKCYVDLTKAYDRVDRNLLWQILARIGVPAKMLAVIKGLHVGARGQVR